MDSAEGHKQGKGAQKVFKITQTSKHIVLKFLRPQWPQWPVKVPFFT